MGLEAKVEVEITVDEKGTVDEARIVSGHPFFHSNSIKAASAAKFEPLELAGKPVWFRTSIVFTFRRPGNAGPPKVGIINGRAITLPKPELTQQLKDLCAIGEVGIEVLVSEKGSVIGAKPIFGDELLYDSALIAAKQATFRTVDDAPPVRSNGIIVYTFPSEKPCVDVGNVNGKWITRPSFSVPSLKTIKRSTPITVRLGIEPFTGKVLAAKMITDLPSIRTSIDKQALRLKFHPSLINSKPIIVKGVITLKILPNGTVTF